MYNSREPLKTTFRGSSAVEQATVNICVSISIYMPDKFEKVESGILQLPDESQDEKRGEFGEPLTLK